MISADDVKEWMATQEEAMDRRIADADRLPKLERLIELRERLSLPLDFTVYWTAPTGATTPVVSRPFHAEIERVRERLRFGGDSRP